jgi:hypothetical protein
MQQRRDERSRGRQAAAEARRRRKRMQQIAMIAAGALVVLVGGFFLVRAVTASEPGEEVAVQPSDHVDQSTTVTDYNSDPPTSGNHWGSTAEWGVHEEPVANELQVHNLEHGGVVIQYNRSVPPEQVEVLREITNQCNVKLLLAPRPEMTSAVAVTSWGYVLHLDSVDREQIQEFIGAHVDEGPEKIQTESILLEDCNL